MKKDSRELARMIASGHSRIPAGTTWRHYKGGIYRVNGFIVNTDTDNLMIKYNRIDGPDFEPVTEQYIEFARPIGEWFDDVEESPGVFVPRFKQVKAERLWK
jgi:hypothetical protein